jgi:hypothetical protein
VGKCIAQRWADTMGVVASQDQTKQWRQFTGIVTLSWRPHRVPIRSFHAITISGRQDSEENTAQRLCQPASALLPLPGSIRA